MADLPPADKASGVNDSTPEYGADDAGTLQYLFDVCNDAADGALRFAQMFDDDNDPVTAEMFRNLATMSSDFAHRLFGLLVDRQRSGTGKARRTFRGQLLRWRLQIAEHVPVGYGTGDDRRFLLHLAERGSDLLEHSYAEAKERVLAAPVREEIESQSAEIKAAARRIRELAGRADGPPRTN